MPAGEVIVLSDYAGRGGAATGGAGIAVADSFRALRAAGMRARLVVGIASPGEAAPVPGREELGGADLRAGSTLAALRTVYNPAARHALGRVLASQDPHRTVIVLHQWTRYLTPAAIALLRPFPLMVYMHDYFWACPTGNYFDFGRGAPCTRTPGSPACIVAGCDRAGYAHKAVRLARHAALALAERGAARPRLFLHISEQARRVAAPLLAGGSHHVVYNPIDMPERPPRSDRRDDAPLHDVGYFGRLEDEKGIGQLIDALVRRGLTGLFVGEGALAARIASTPGMTLMGWQAQAAVAKLMARCRTVALPSLWPETWGLIVPEAMALGVPVLVSARAGSSELVARFGGGAVFDPEHPATLDAILDHRRADAETTSLTPPERTAMRAFLSPRRHAETIARLALDAWGIDLTDAQAKDATAPVSATR